jgi:hypothetical protein
VITATEDLLVRISRLVQAIDLGISTRRLTSANRRRIVKSGLFDPEWYLRHAPEAADSRRDPLDHYFHVGWKNGRSPGRLFDSAWYLQFYNDVNLAGWEPLLHFLRYGKREGRSQRGAQGSIFDSFQSLGEDCEFGFVQRHFGSNTLGLFRFARTTVDGLIAFLDRGLDHLVSPTEIEIKNSGIEYSTHIPPHEFSFHTYIPTRTSNVDEIRTHEINRMKFLSRKLAEELKEGTKIFVHKTTQPSIPKVQQLADRLRRFGPNRLLCVVLAPNTQKIGTLELVSDGLAVGYIDRFDCEPSRCSMEVWSALCLKAHVLWSHPEGTAVVKHG